MKFTIKQLLFEKAMNISITKSQKWEILEDAVKTNSILFGNVLRLRTD